MDAADLGLFMGNIHDVNVNKFTHGALKAWCIIIKVVRMHKQTGAEHDHSDRYCHCNMNHGYSRNAKF